MEREYEETVIVCRADDVISIGDNIRIVVMGVNGRIARLGVDAPRSVSVHRDEVYNRIIQGIPHCKNSPNSTGPRT